MCLSALQRVSAICLRQKQMLSSVYYYTICLCSKPTHALSIHLLLHPHSLLSASGLLPSLHLSLHPFPVTVVKSSLNGVAQACEKENLFMAVVLSTFSCLAF